jgi:Fe-S oxidoreductase
MYAMGFMPWAGRLTASWPSAARLANTALGAPAVGRALKGMAGIATNRPAPRFSTAGGLRTSTRRELPEAIDRAPRDTSVVIWPDTFTDAFRPEVGNDLVVAMEALGERVAVPSGWACCGRTLYDFGMLDVARRSLRRLLKVLGPWVTAGVPVVVAEPSCLAAFRDELPHLLADDPRSAKLASLARSPAEHLVANGHTARLAADGPGTDVGRAVVHAHCHQRAVVGTDADQAVLAALGYEVEVLDAGCCGLAGSFGFDAHHEPVSRTIGEDLWLPKVRAALGNGDGRRAQLVVDGFSCHTQLEHLGPELLPQATTIPALVRSRQTGLIEPSSA